MREGLSLFTHLLTVSTPLDRNRVLLPVTYTSTWIAFTIPIEYFCEYSQFYKIEL